MDLLQSKKDFIPNEMSDTLRALVIRMSGIDSLTKQKYEREMKLIRKQYHINPRKAQISLMYKLLLKDEIISRNVSLEKLIKAKEMRGLSGVIVISVITSPYPEYMSNGVKKKQRFSCKHDCFYCPREVDENGKEINPRSYLSDEPTVARGLQHGFNVVNQYNDRARQYHVNGHIVDKIEIIVLGGTWTEYPREYQKTFIRDIFWAANTFYDTIKRDKFTLVEEQIINETTKSRIIGLTLEMRPDSINHEEINWLRNLGCTRIQLGVQHIDDTILKGVNRGCYYKDTTNALRLLKNVGYKIDAHWMPDLPGSSVQIDRDMFKYIIDSEDLQFDQWKIYPTATVPWTRIKKWYEEGKYMPYTETDPESLIKLLLDIKQKVPPWIRLNRVIRDIPNSTRNGDLYIYAGNKVTNLRQILHNRLREQNGFCSCIRCREVKKNIDLLDCHRIVTRKYNSSGGVEYFISIESGNTRTSVFINGKWYNDNIAEPGIIYGFIRLRLGCENESENSYFPKLKHSALIRELHVYGQVTNLLKAEEHKAQHLGFGKQLMRRAEYISVTNGYFRIAVISGVGVRNYYRKLGYSLVNTYMIKDVTFKIYILVSLLICFNIYVLKYIFIKGTNI